MKTSARLSLLASLILALAVSPSAHGQAPKLDSETLVVPAPVKPETRTPDEDIRRLLRPEESILVARERLDKDIIQRTTELARLETQEKLVSDDLDRTFEHFDLLTAARDEERAVVRRRLATMMRVKRRPSAQILLTSKSYAEFSNKVEARERLYEADRRRVVAYREQLAQWRIAKKDLARRRANLANTQETIAYMRQELAWDQQEQAALQSAVRNQAEFYAAYVREMEALDPVLTELVAGAIDPSRGRLYFAETKGRMGHPMRNADIVGRFGIRSHGRFPVTANWRGIHMVPLRPGAHTEIRAIYWGYVGYVGWVRGLGQVVVLDHTLGYTTIYAHLDRIDVSVGEKVSTGQALGQLGDSGSFHGQRLYMELRDQGKAANPLRWIK